MAAGAQAHGDYIRSLAVHPTLPYLLSCSDDMLIKLWDWDKGFSCAMTFEGHVHYVMQARARPHATPRHAMSCHAAPSYATPTAARARTPAAAFVRSVMMDWTKQVAAPRSGVMRGASAHSHAALPRRPASSAPSACAAGACAATRCSLFALCAGPPCEGGSRAPPIRFVPYRPRLPVLQPMRATRAMAFGDGV